MKSGAFINHSVFTPQRFAQLAPYMQTEALLLAVECGNPPGVVAAAINATGAKVAEIMQSRHAHRLPMAAAAEKETAVERPTNRHRIAAMLHKMGAADRAARLSVTTIMSGLDIGNASATRALRQMISDRWIIRTEPSSPIEAAAYILTEIGAAAAEEAL